MNFPSLPPSASDPSATALMGDPVLLRALRDDMSHSPHAVLGAHPAVFAEQSGVVVRAFHPDAIACTLLLGVEARPMLALGGGVFAVFLAQAKLPLAYRLRFGFGNGSTWEREDPYRFLPSLGDLDLHLIGEGTHRKLWTVLGSHAQQKGSLVGPDRLRFDFTSPRALTPEEITKVEDLVNQRTLQNHTVQTEVLSMDEARARGAMMIFEEKYGDVVRMLSMGESTELCGGTHARATGDIGLFKIVSEQGVSAGVRRIIAVTGDGALAYLRDVETNFAKVVSLAKATPANVLDKVEKLLQHERALEKQIDELQRKLATGGGGGGLEALLAKARDIAGVKVLGVRTEVTDRAALRELAEQLRDKLGQSVVLVGSVADGKAQLVLTVAKDLTSRLKAGDLIKNSAQIVGGSGGGRPDMAQAGGTELARLDEAIEAIYASVG